MKNSIRYLENEILSLKEEQKIAYMKLKELLTKRIWFNIKFSH